MHLRGKILLYATMVSLLSLFAGLAVFHLIALLGDRPLALSFSLSMFGLSLLALGLVLLASRSFLHKISEPASFEPADAATSVVASSSVSGSRTGAGSRGLLPDGSEEMLAQIQQRDRELRLSEERYRSLVELAPVPIIVQRRGKFLYLNPASVALFGATRMEELVGRNVLDYVHPEDRAEIQTAVEQHGAGSHRVDRRSLRLVRNGNELIHLDITAMTVNFEGQPARLVIAVDNTERKWAEAERERLLCDLAQKNEELESIIYFSSHDLRSPLINIAGFGRELDRSCSSLETELGELPMDERRRGVLDSILKNRIPRSLKYIHASATRMDQLIRGMLKISGLGQEAVDSKFLEMDTLLAGIVDSMKYQIGTAGAGVELGELPPCLGDMDQVIQIFSNLLDNAIKYRHPERTCRIRISGEAAAPDVRDCVEDNVRGIPEHQLSRIFKIFQRINPHGEVDGEGLGLAIVQKILIRNNGRVEVESTEGVGSRFYVHLPAAETSPG